MGFIKEFQDLWQSLSNHRFMKNLIIVFFILVILLLGLVVVKIGLGQHVKMLGFEINDNPKNEITHKPQQAIQSNTQTVILDTNHKKTSQPKNTIKPTQKNIKIHALLSKEIKTDSIKPAIVQKNTTGPNTVGNNNTNAKNVLNAGNGQFNAPVNVGDTYSEHHLQKDDEEYLLRIIPEMKRQYGILNDTVEVSRTLNTNGAVYEYELVNFLKSNRIPIHQIHGFTSNKDHEITNVQIYPQNGRINIVVGTMINKQ